MPELDPGVLDEMIATWQDLHAHPELGFEEQRTAALVAERLKAVGIEVEEKVGKTGVVGTLTRDRPGPTLLLRAEIDALPITEETGLPYASRRKGLMHACGHDAHTAILLAVAQALSRWKSLPGVVRLAFQPAEELGRGAQAMLASGAMRGRPVDAVLALHMHAHIPLGQIGICQGAAAASAGEFTIDVAGKGGHSAFPDQLVDPVATAANIITALHTLVPRETSPVDPAVIGVSALSGGRAFNVVPDSVQLRGTVRAGDSALHERLATRAEQVAIGIARSFRCTATFTHRSLCPPVRNDEGMAILVREVAAELAGGENVLTPKPVMAADDLAFFFAEAPGCYPFIGIAPRDGRPEAPHHNSRFRVDEQAVVIGARLLLGASERFLATGH